MKRRCQYDEWLSTHCEFYAASQKDFCEGHEKKGYSRRSISNIKFGTAQPRTKETLLDSKAAYIQGYADAIATLFDKKGGQKVAYFNYTWDDLKNAGVSDLTIKKVSEWLYRP